MASKKGNGSKDEHLEVLRAIWNEMKGLNARIDKTNERLDAVRVELKSENEALRRELHDDDDALRRRMVESEVRLSTVVTKLSSDVQELSGLIREWREEHRSDRAELRARVARLE